MVPFGRFRSTRIALRCRRMKYDPHAHHRRSIRLSAFDYRTAGAYFVTICTHERACIFVDPVLRIVAERVWRMVVHKGVIDDFVVMPNHVHGIIWIVESPVGAQHGRTTVEQVGGLYSAHTPGPAPSPTAAPLRPERARSFAVQAGSLAATVRAFKAITTNRTNRVRKTPAATLWQRNYYERVIRNDHELATIRQYIRDNPHRWREDEHNPANIRHP